jgi:hypothetical protein
VTNPDDVYDTGILCTAKVAEYMNDVSQEVRNYNNSVVSLASLSQEQNENKRMDQTT